MKPIEVERFRNKMINLKVIDLNDTALITELRKLESVMYDIFKLGRVKK